MVRPPNIVQTLIQCCDRPDDFVVATVLMADGSTPVGSGARAVMLADGSLHGTIGGGMVEAEAQRRARDAIRRGQAAAFDFSLQSAEVHGGQPICGGQMRILIDPTARRHRGAYAAAAEALRQQNRGVLLTFVRGQDPVAVEVRFVPEDSMGGAHDFPDATALRAALRQEQCLRLLATPSPHDEPLEVFLEPVVPQPVLLIVGGGHVGRAVAIQATALGFVVVVLDDRPEFAHPDRFPEGTTARCGDVLAELNRFPFSPETYIVLVTRGHQGDAEALAACLPKPSAYLGMIGSRRKVALMRQQFIQSGQATAAQFDRVYAPIGLDIGAVTVPEIALSIVAQLVAVRRHGRADRIVVDGARG